MAANDVTRTSSDATLGTVVTYVIWFFFGMFGAHRFMTGRVFTGLMMLLINGLGWLTFWFGLGYLIWAALGIWWLIDALRIPGWLRR